MPNKATNDGRSMIRRLAAAGIVFIIFTLAMWKLERWLDWQYDYESRTNARINALEGRIIELEKELVDVKRKLK